MDNKIILVNANALIIIWKTIQVKVTVFETLKVLEHIQNKIQTRINP